MGLLEGRVALITGASRGIGRAMSERFAREDAAVVCAARSPDQVKPEHTKRVVQTCYHPTSTCAIGRVVDPELRVFGVDGLRVVDASVMPSVIRGNTNAPTIMIAEKAPDMLRGSVHQGACSRVAGSSYQRRQN